MSLKLMVEGDKEKVNKFMEVVRKTSIYRFYDKFKYNLNPLESREEYYFDERNQLKEKKNYDLTVIHLETTDGQQIKIDLVDTKIVDMAVGKTLIIGKNFDIFAIPEDK
jgi:hypothetical protein